MRDETQATLSCLPAKLIAPIVFLANRSVADCNAHSPYLIYGSLRYSSAPSALRKPASHPTTLRSYLSSTFIRSAINSWSIRNFSKDVVRECEQVVGKVVTKLVQKFKLYKLGMDSLVYIAKCVFSVRRLLAVYTQDIVVCAHTKYRVYIDSVSFLYTLPTGPTNTNNLIKG